MFQNQRGTGTIGRRSGTRGKCVIRSLLFSGLLITLAASAAPAPIKLAVFDFELEDFSPSASSAGVTPADAAHLASVTDTVRQLFAQSQRYALIDVGSADAPAVKTHTLRDCDGCEAGIALKLGAEQSMIGIVSRISRTEYVVRFQVRDARTGSVLATGDSGLRMGADYAWGRGAARLVKDLMLEDPPAR